MKQEKNLVCYRFQCARYLTCALSGGTGCCLERDPEQQEVPDGACTKEKGYPYFRPGKEEDSVRAWMRGH